MKRDLLEALERMFDDYPVMRAGGVPDGEIDELERSVEFVLPASYREFVSKYGGAIVGSRRIYGLRAAGAMGNLESSAKTMTDHFKRQRWPGVNQWLIISLDLAGNPIGLDKEGKIWISDHDAGTIEVIVDTFEEYLEQYCLQ